jgi:hypothetical protein
MARFGFSIALCSLMLGACGSLVPEGRAPAKPQRSVQTALHASRREQMCLAELGTQHASFEPLPDRYYGAGCSTLGSVSLSAVASDRGRLALANLGPVACPLANTFAGWARFGVDRAARQILGSPLARIETMGSYSCRTVAGTERLSAHARAEAIDVAAFVLADGRRISVLDDWQGADGGERQFLRVVHESACKRFGTVLGPDYNAAHRNHFHVELGGNSYCR